MYKDLKREYDALNEEIQTVVEKMQKKAQPLVEAVVKEFLEKYPIVEYIHWTQYTPYFNDGEECTFSINDICFTFFDDEQESYESSDLYDASDLDSYTKIKKDVEDYTNDELAYVQSKKNEYIEKYGRVPPTSIIFFKPYYTIDEINGRIDDIVANMKKYADLDHAQFKSDFKELSESIMTIPEDVLKSVYGDHVEVVISLKDGTEIDDYDHD